jgi:hypothetical protein
VTKDDTPLTGIRDNMVSLTSPFLLILAASIILGILLMFCVRGYLRRILALLTPISCLFLTSYLFVVLPAQRERRIMTMALPIIGDWMLQDQNSQQLVTFKTDGSIIKHDPGSDKIVGSFSATESDRVALHWVGDEYGEIYKLSNNNDGFILSSTGPSGAQIRLRHAK